MNKNSIKLSSICSNILIKIKSASSRALCKLLMNLCIPPRFIFSEIDYMQQWGRGIRKIYR